MAGGGLVVIDPALYEAAPLDPRFRRRNSDSVAPTVLESDDEVGGFLLDTALLHHRLWETGKDDAAEIRLRVAKFGATVEDRSRLRMTVQVPGESETTGTPQLAAVTDLDARRFRVAS